MKLTALASAVVLAVAAAPVHAAPLYAFSVANNVCALRATGMKQKDAYRAAWRTAWPVYGDDIERDGVDVASRYVVMEQLQLCGLE